MATSKDQLVWELEVSDKATKTLHKTEKATKQVDKAMDDMGKAAGKASAGSKDLGKGLDHVEKGADKATKGSKKLDSTLGDLKTSSLAAGFAIMEMAQYGGEAIGTFRELEATTTRYEFTVKNLGATTADISKAQVTMAENFDKTGVSIEAQQQALSRLTLKLDDPAKALDHLQITMDLAAASGEELADVAKDIGEAATGDINGLEEMGILVEEDTDRLREMTDAGDRAAAAMEILERKVGGASGEMDSQLIALNKLENGFREVKGSTGGFLVNLGGIVVEIGKLSNLVPQDWDVLKRFEDLENSAESIYKYLQLINKSDDTKMFEAEQQRIKEIRSDAESVRDTISNHPEPSRAVPEWLDTYASFKEAELEGGNQQLGPEDLLIPDAAALKRFKETGETAMSLEQALKRLSKVKTAAEATSLMDGNFSRSPVSTESQVEDAERRQASSDEGGGGGGGGGPDLAAAARADRERVAAARLKAAQAQSEEERISLELAAQKLSIKQQDLTKAEEELALHQASTAANEKLMSLWDSQEAKKADSAAAEKDARWRNIIAEAEIKRANATSERQEIEAEFLTKQLELARKVEEGSVTSTEAELTMLEAKQDKEKELHDLRTKHLDEMAEADKQRQEDKERREEEAHERKMKQLREELSMQEGMADSISGAFNAIGSEEGAALGTLTSDLQQVNAQFQMMDAEGAGAAEKLEASISAGGAATSQFLEQMGVGYREVAGIRALFESGAAVASFASGNIPGGIGHATAAGIFGGMAAAGPTAPDPKASAGSGGGGPEYMSTDEAFEKQKRAHFEALREAQRGSREFTTYIDQRNSYFLERSAVGRRQAREGLNEDPRLSLGD